MRLLIEKSAATGSITLPPSKSLLHRALIFSALANGESEIANFQISADADATLRSLRALGTGLAVDEKAKICRVVPPKEFASSPLFCGESASTLRMLLPLCLLDGKERTVFGKEPLFRRGLEGYDEIFRRQGVSFKIFPDRITLSGRLLPGEYRLPGNFSSQYLSGLFFALPLLPGDSRILLTTPPESFPYSEMTRRFAENFSVKIEKISPAEYVVPGNQRPKGTKLVLEPDCSAAAFFAAFNETDSSLSLPPLPEKSLQGDADFPAFFRALDREKAELDVSNHPDLAPVLIALAALKRGAVLTGTRRLAKKESDRGRAMAQELARCGGRVLVQENRIVVERSPLFAPSEPFSSHNDHRIAMALSLVAARLGAVIDGAECVQKSDPLFWQRLSLAGLKIIKLSEETR